MSDAQDTNVRLDTPDSVGYRAGMTSTCVIGRNLGKVYTPPADAPQAIHELAHVIDRELERSR